LRCPVEYDCDQVLLDRRHTVKLLSNHVDQVASAWNGRPALCIARAPLQ
jgi:hypothetical protein